MNYQFSLPLKKVMAKTRGAKNSVYNFSKCGLQFKNLLKERSIYNVIVLLWYLVY